MTHTPKAIRSQRLNDQSIGVTVRCCGDPATDSVTTIQAGISATDIDAMIEQQKQKVAAQHQAMLDAEAAIAAKMQTEQQ